MFVLADKFTWWPELVDFGYYDYFQTNTKMYLTISEISIKIDI